MLLNKESKKQVHMHNGQVKMCMYSEWGMYEDIYTLLFAKCL